MTWRGVALIDDGTGGGSGTGGIRRAVGRGSSGLRGAAASSRKRAKNAATTLDHGGVPRLAREFPAIRSRR